MCGHNGRQPRPRLEACRALDCGWLFLDNSRNASRRWCEMDDCGNRARGRRSGLAPSRTSCTNAER
ncbi:CGNR zinc finger domain-containing protein [Cryptosporangium sp. NPDC048952]|uniref:CGNR zinc finger domain-containing protein n=1 Tax=Cryptosporangium sp. NPDC048952 TaxID=3363961 RepID=UPI0037137FAB